MATKEYIQNFLNGKVSQAVKKRELQKELQDLLNTKNRFENGDDSDDTEPYDFCMYFTNGDTYQTSNLCDIRIDYLKTRNKGVIYVTNYEILHYIK